jgi:hypothetical protein
MRRRPTGVIDIHAEVDEQTLRIEVRDTGRSSRSEGHGPRSPTCARALRRSSARAHAHHQPNLPHGVVAAIEIPR